MSYPITDAGEDEMRAELTALEKLNEDVDQLSSDARDCDSLCPEAKMMLDLAWWFTEEAIRGATGACSAACTVWKFCACCHHFRELKPRADRIRRLLRFAEPWRELSRWMSQMLPAATRETGEPCSDQFEAGFV